MNKPLKTSQRATLTLGDLIVAVSEVSRNSREAALAVADLFQSRRIVLGDRRRAARR
jgi:hypothetical protein